jgi:hypothetical protein
MVNVSSIKVVWRESTFGQEGYAFGNSHIHDKAFLATRLYDYSLYLALSGNACLIKNKTSP